MSRIAIDPPRLGWNLVAENGSKLLSRFLGFRCRLLFFIRRYIMRRKISKHVEHESRREKGSRVSRGNLNNSGVKRESPNINVVSSSLHK